MKEGFSAKNRAAGVLFTIFSISACTDTAGPVPELEHYNIDIVACVETGPENGDCEGQLDIPLEVPISVKDIYGNVLASALTSEGQTVIEIDIEQKQMLDLAYPNPFLDQNSGTYVCPAKKPIIKYRGTTIEATIAYSKCFKTPQPETLSPIETNLSNLPLNEDTTQPVDSLLPNRVSNN